jgi:glycerol uptake facilitator-like aquaporin
MNPAITVVRRLPLIRNLPAHLSLQSLAIFRGFPWRLVGRSSPTFVSTHLTPCHPQVPRYIIAQVLGAFVGALIIYGK